MLRQHIEPTGPGRLAVQFMRRDGLGGGDAFHHLEAVGRDQHGMGGFVHAVVGAPDALQQAGDSLRRADLDHLVHVAPVDAEVERGGRHHGAQPAFRHRGLDLAAQADLEAAMVHGDGQGGFVQPPQGREDQFRLGAGVDEDDRHPRALDAAVNLGRRGEAHMPAPGQAPFRQLQVEDRRGAALGFDQPHIVGARGGRQPGPQGLRMRDGGR